MAPSSSAPQPPPLTAPETVLEPGVPLRLGGRTRAPADLSFRVRGARPAEIAVTLDGEPVPIATELVPEGDAVEVRDVHVPEGDHEVMVELAARAAPARIEDLRFGGTAVDPALVA